MQISKEFLAGQVDEKNIAMKSLATYDAIRREKQQRFESISLAVITLIFMLAMTITYLTT